MGQPLIYMFIALMWGLILVGGGILVALVAQISIEGYGEDLDSLISSIIKAIIALGLVAVWIILLTKLKNKIFQKQLRS